MAEISKITLPSGNTYDIKDAYARQLIAGGLSFIVAWNGTAAPVVADIPAGVTVTYNGTDYTGTLAAADAEVGSFYLVKSSSQGDDLNKYSEYAVVGRGDDRSWEKMGDTTLDLSSLGDLAYYDSVTLSKGSGDKVLGSDATFTTTVTPTTTNIKATASGVEVDADGTAEVITAVNGVSGSFVSSIDQSSGNLVTTSVPNVTSAGSASTWSFGLGSGSDAETLIISGANGAAPTLGTAKTVATGEVSEGGGGSTVLTGLLTIGDNAVKQIATSSTSALTGIRVTAQPTVALSTGATAGTGVVSVATGVTSATTTTNNKDEVTVAKYGDLSVSVS